MLASQLRGVIHCHSGNFQIPSSMILEAITTLRCAETFSMERLELLGDSVLKYVVSCHLFLTYPKKHEGQLSARRSWTVCNSILYKFGTDCKLQGNSNQPVNSSVTCSTTVQGDSRCIMCKHKQSYTIKTGDI